MSIYNTNRLPEPPQSTNSSNANVYEKLTVLDTCNNELIFIRKADNSVTFEYNPMDPIRSCSGSYSGGTAVFKNLEPGEWAKLLTTYQRAKTEGKVHNSRVKGTSVFTYESGTTSDSVILAFDLFTDKLTSFFHEYRN